MAMYIAKHNCN